MQHASDQKGQQTLRPVIAHLPRALPRSARVEAYRRVGRDVLSSAAKHAGAPPLAFARDEEGAPAPEGRWNWSLTNAEGCVAGLVSDHRVGIDVEPFDRPRREAVLTYLQERDPEGLEFLGSDGTAALHLWTAFEAALKLLGHGVSGLPMTKLETTALDLPDSWYRVRVGPHSIPVWSSRFGEHLLSLAVMTPLDRLPQIAPVTLVDGQGLADGQAQAALYPREELSA